MMNEQKLKDLAAEFAKGIKTEDDLNQFTRLLTKLTVETALNAELTEHLGHKKMPVNLTQTHAMVILVRLYLAMMGRLRSRHHEIVMALSNLS